MPENNKANPSRHGEASRYALSFAIIALAASIGYFTWQIGVVSQQIPALLKSVENTSAQIEPVVKQVGEIQQLVPPITQQVSQIRQQIPEVLKEVAAVRQQVPDIVDATNNASKAIEKAAAEIQALRPVVPEVLNEVKQTREQLPLMLNQAQQIVDSANKAGQEASEGAITGVLTGIISAPFELVGSLGKKLFMFSDEVENNLDAKDIELAKQHLLQALSLKQEKEKVDWLNPDTKTRGRIVLLEVNPENTKNCKKIDSKAWKSDVLIEHRIIIFCLKDGRWVPKKTSVDDLGYSGENTPDSEWD